MDMLHNLDLPSTDVKGTKQKYQQFLRDHNLAQFWEQCHTRAFLQLKQILVSEPILKAPKFNGTPFIVTSDGCKDSFGAVLSQHFMMQLPSGDTIVRTHPVGFASKQTSPAEEQYKPYLLEFTALKFAFDHFGGTIWGFPVEVETDCTALCDMLLNDKASLVYARWRDGILAYQIVTIRHRAGTTNIAADALSRRISGQPQKDGDDSAWSVSKDWESVHSLVNDLLHISDTDTATIELKTCFANEPLFLEVIEAMYNLDNGKSEQDHSVRRLLEFEGELIERE
jgi:hypothetical protein